MAPLLKGAQTQCHMYLAHPSRSFVSFSLQSLESNLADRVTHAHKAQVPTGLRLSSVCVAQTLSVCLAAGGQMSGGNNGMESPPSGQTTTKGRHL